MAALPQRKLRLFLIPLLCLSGAARAQSRGASVKMSGEISEMVALSSPGANVSADGVSVTSSHVPDRSLSITLSGATRDPAVIRIPVQIRSNTGYWLFLAADSDGSKISSLSVVDARPTGNLVTADAVGALSVGVMYDARPGAGNLIPAVSFNHPNFSPLMELLSGPRVSIGGTLGSPQNALEVTLSVVVEPRADYQSWAVELLLSVEPAARF